MATVPSDSSATEQTAAEQTSVLSSDRAVRRSKRRKTSHLKMVPETREMRDHLRAKCEELAAKIDKSRPISKDELEKISRQLLAEEGLVEGYVGWIMVVFSSMFWKDQVAAVPPSRRLFLLPHCLKHAEGCPADYDEFGLDCKTCGACSIADFRTTAEEMGYKVLVAEGSPIVLKIIVSGYIDAIVGVACLNVLEKAIDKILLAGIPCMAIPLLSSDCRNTSVDEDWVQEMISLEEKKPEVHTQSYVHLMRAANSMFEPAELKRLVPPVRKQPVAINDETIAALDPISATEAISYDFLSKGGKHSRPFITLAAYDALTGGKGTLVDGKEQLEKWSDSIRRTAMAIEVFHKASLVHDDIQDDDQFRYGDDTLHRKYGTATAINIGDYLIGMGYRLVSRDAAEHGPEVAADILDCLADAHLKLSEGQGAELLWRDSNQKDLKPLDALKIYALKTAPAFEAALFSGIRLAGPIADYKKPIVQFARNLGVAFQILNDLKDWQGDQDNKLAAGGDVFGGRPTVLWALALAGLNEQDADELRTIVTQNKTDAAKLSRVRYLYEKANVFEQAARLVDKYQAKAEEIADSIEPDEFRRLLYYLIDTVLERADNEPMISVIQPELPILNNTPQEQ